MISKRAYITMLGRSVWGMVNSYNAVLREDGYLPDEIYIFIESRYRKDAEKGLAAFAALNEEFGISPPVKVIDTNDADFINAGRQMSEIIGNLKRQGWQIALDITPGRKAMVAGALVPAMKQDLEHIYYLEIADLSDAARPYMEIPLRQQRLWDFGKEGGAR